MPGNVWSCLRHSDKAAATLTEYMVRSGLLATLPFEEACRQAAKDVGELIANGTLVVEEAGSEIWLRNKESKMNSDHQVCYFPMTDRHAWGTSKSSFSIPDEVMEEVEFMSNIKWTVNPTMFKIAKKIESDPSMVDYVNLLSIRVADEFIRQRDNGGQDHFYLPIFLDDVLRSYAEGALSYTNDQFTRYLTDTYEKVFYSRERLAELEPKIKELTGVTCENYKNLLQYTEICNTLKTRGKSAWFIIRTAIFLKEVLEEGWSSGECPLDRKTSGQSINAMQSGDRNLLTDCNLSLAGDGHDLRRTVLRFVRLPRLLTRFEEIFLGLPFAKKTCTQINYGQGPEGGADSCFWKDPKKMTLIPGWRTTSGVVNETMMKSLDPAYFNPDYIQVIDALGFRDAWKAFYQMNAEYNDVYWRIYSTARIMHQRLEDAYDFLMGSRTHPLSWVGANGYVYTHQKWVIDKSLPDFRWRQKRGIDRERWPNGLELKIGGMVNTAKAHSVGVRRTHKEDARERCGHTHAYRKSQMNRYARFIGIKVIHDAFLIPWDQVLDAHDIMRPTLHELVDTTTRWTNEFLIAGGQEKMENEEVDSIHKAIASNRDWLTAG
jgi:hypothetical protein